MSQTSKELGAARSSRDAAEDAAPMGLTLLEVLQDALTEINALRGWIDTHVRANSVTPAAWAEFHKPLVTKTVTRNLRAAIAKAEGAS